MSHRIFIAIELDKAVAQNLDRFCSRLQHKYGLDDRAINWVKPSNIHLTLKFLGDVDDGDIPKVCDCLNEVAVQFDGFDFEIADCGCFPPKGPARILWAGIDQGKEDLQALAEAIDMGCNELGFTLKNKPFRGHLTLARIKQAKVGYAVRDALENIEPFNLGIQPVNQIALVESILTRNGPEYTPMHHASLGES
jgi:2'-5' RNA ligase